MPLCIALQAVWLEGMKACANGSCSTLLHLLFAGAIYAAGTSLAVYVCASL